MEELDSNMVALLLLSSSFFRLSSRARSCFNLIKKRHSNIKTLYVTVWGSSSYLPGTNTINFEHFRDICKVLYTQGAGLLPPATDLRVLLQAPHPSSPQITINPGNKVGLLLVERELTSSLFTSLNPSTEEKDDLLVKILGVARNDKIQLELESDTPEDESTDLKPATPPQSTDNGNPKENQMFKTVAVGGTFDRIHNGHKILLTEAISRAEKEFIVGVTDENMTQSKTLNELIEPCNTRILKVQEFLSDITHSKAINLRVVPLSDPFGPTITEEDVDAIIVSEETEKGALKINEIRSAKSWAPLYIHTIGLCSEPAKQSQHEDDKISSSSKRMRLLGERLSPPLSPVSLPYIIGLTGGIASGKSSAAAYLRESLGQVTIDCDRLGHEAYRSGTDCFKGILETFGADLLSQDGEINRRLLGSKVFGNPIELKKLTDLVWPEIKRIAMEKIECSAKEGNKLIFVDAAVLFEAGWDSFCHDVWVFFVPPEEAIKRVMERDGLTREAVQERLKSQMTNRERIEKGTFAFSSLWEKEFTRSQINKALNIIKSNLLSNKL